MNLLLRSLINRRSRFRNKLVDEQLERGENEERQNLTYRGQTWQEHLEEEGVTEEQHREQDRRIAERNVKASLVLSEIAETRDISNYA